MGWFDAADAALTSRLAVLNDTAGGAPPADQHAKCGGVSAAEGKRKERRSIAIDDAPSFGAALATGSIGAELCPTTMSRSQMKATSSQPT